MHEFNRFCSKIILILLILASNINLTVCQPDSLCDAFIRCKNYYTKSIAEQKQLTSLDFSGYKCKYFPEIIYSYVEIIDIDISGTIIDTLPDNFCHFKKLTVFSANYSYLKVLPDCFGELSNLKHFAACEAEIEYLPESFGNLINLEELCLYCPIKALPKSFINLQNLNQLSIKWDSHNPFPEQIFKLRNLKNIDFQVINGEPYSESEKKAIEKMLPLNCKVGW